MVRPEDFHRGVGIGGWLSNYKRWRFIPPEYRELVTEGDRLHFENFITEKDFQQIASWGADHIRLAFDYLPLQDPEDVMKFPDRNFVHLDRAVEWGKKLNLNMVLDLHRAAGGSCEYKDDFSLLEQEEKQERFLKLWECVARRYASESHLAFELLNELVPPNRADDWNPLVRKAVSVIRNITPERTILVGGGGHNGCGSLRSLELGDDPLLLPVFHFYGPHQFTHQRTPNEYRLAAYNRVMEYPGPADLYADCIRFCGGTPQMDGLKEINKEYLRTVMDDAFTFRRDSKRPLICSEFGCIRHAPKQSKTAWFRDMISLFREYDISYSAWNYLTPPYDTNRFSLVDDDDRRPLLDEVIKILFP